MTKAAEGEADIVIFDLEDAVAEDAKGGAREARAPYVFAVNAVASVLVVSVSVVCDQVDQVVPAHQVDDIDEVHELDPVHQVDHKDEYGFVYIAFYRVCK